MSYLDYPRVYFRGCFRANAATGNNYQTQRFCGDLPIPPKCEKQVRIFDVATATIDVLTATDGRDLTDDEMLQVLAANDPKMWNYEGGNTITLEETVITGFDLGSGLRTDDPLVGAAVLMNRAAMVDINPAGILHTQIFSDDFIVEGEGIRIEGAPTRSFSRWVWFGRNPSFKDFYPPTGQASAVFQFALPASTVSIKGPGSPVLNALRAGDDGAYAGLTVRFCLYAMRTRAEGELNPGWGRVSGVIGVQASGDMTSHPVSRRLQPEPDQKLGPAFATLDRSRGRVTLDLVTTIPEKTVELEKEDLGRLEVRLRTEEGSHTIGVLDYSEYARDAYEATSGIVVCPFESQALPQAPPAGEGVLEIVDGSGSVLLREAPIMPATDHGATYIQAGESRELIVRTFDRGVSAPAKLTVQQFVTTYTGDPPPKPDPKSRWIVDVPDAVESGPDGRVVVPISGKCPGICAIRFTVEGDPEDRGYDRLRDALALVRVLPEDDYSHIRDDQLRGQAGFDLIYEEVFRYYYVLYPVMRTIVDFSSYPFMQETAKQLKAAIAKDNWTRYSYMPRSRELSDGKRRLVERWCDVAIAERRSVSG